MRVQLNRDDGQGTGAQKEDRPMAGLEGARSHLLGHLVDPRGRAVA